MRFCGVVVVLLAGCHWIFPHGSPSGPLDGSLDVAASEWGLDGRLVDAFDPEPPRHDLALRDAKLQPPDAGKPDDGGSDGKQAPDAGKADAGKADVGKADLGKADVGKADLGKTDLGGAVPDAAADGVKPAAFACAQGAKVVHTWPSGTMKICEDQSVYVNQCSADKLCNLTGGWYLCSGTEYRQRGGMSSGLTNLAWIKACVRSGGAPHAPTDGLCDPTCTYSSGAIVETAWECASGAPAYPLAPKQIGAVSRSMCYRLGKNDPANEAYWAPLNITTTSHAAVCCSP